jgi:glycerophosphoryl diester phosphodiesterase
VFGHRGAAGLAPENTLPSFSLAAALGAEYLELDVHATRDGSIVVLHDSTLERTTDGQGLVSELHLAALERLDAGHHFTHDGRHFPYRGQGVRVPTLEAVLQAFPDHRVNIEIKQAHPPIVDAVLDVIRDCGALERVLLAGEHDVIMETIRTAAGERVATGMSVGDVVDFIARCNESRWDDYRPPGQALQVPPEFEGVQLISADTIAAARRFGIEVHAWTINDRVEIDRLFELGVDGIMSDLPGLVTAAATRRRTGVS